MAQKKQRKDISDLIGDTLVEERSSSAEKAEVVQLDAAPKRKKRDGVINTSLYLPKAVLKQVKELAVTEDVKPHDLYLEAIDMLFKQRGLKSIDDLTTS